MAGRTTLKRGFTLVELLTVVAIIGLLIAILVPGLHGAKRSAKEAAVRTLITSANSSLEMFQGDQRFGGSLPPSASDSISDPGMIHDPLSALTSPVRISGSSLLVYALAGPDNRGTAGFKATDKPWADTYGGATGELHDPSMNNPRAEPYAASQLLQSIKALKDVEGGAELGLNAQELQQRVFVDKFNTPLLYYRARKAARQMITKPNTQNAIGVYDHRDNAILTGGLLYGGASAVGFPPVDKQRINSVNYPGDANFCLAAAQLGDANYNFDEYIWDRKSVTGATRVDVELRPVRASEFLLISAGADRIYGTKDDITNWQ